MHATELLNVRQMRKDRTMNQRDFWGPLGVTQSGGSRYESGRKVPKPVHELVRLHHVLNIDTSKITPENAEAIRAILGEAA